MNKSTKTIIDNRVEVELEQMGFVRISRKNIATGEIDTVAVPLDVLEQAVEFAKTKVEA